MLKLGVDIIKIDKMFSDAFGTDRNSTTTVETLVDLARTMLVVAEGVENLSKSCTCTRLGCVRNKTMYLHPSELFSKAHRSARFPASWFDTDDRLEASA